MFNRLFNPLFSAKARFVLVVSVLLSVLFTSPLFAAPTIEMQTSVGKIVLELDSVNAPKTVQNFLQYAQEGFYDDTIFHRVINGFMIQGGGFNKDMQVKPTKQAIANEAALGVKNGLKNQRGSIAMARRNDPHSATAQFFINQQDNPMLDHNGESWGYAVFGRVTQGMDVVDRIAKLPVRNQGAFENVPLTPVLIQSVKIIASPADLSNKK
ncbi:MAG: peptidylprolyl isomerase [Pseudomonadota bacterium]